MKKLLFMLGIANTFWAFAGYTEEDILAHLKERSGFEPSVFNSLEASAEGLITFGLTDPDAIKTFLKMVKDGEYGIPRDRVVFDFERKEIDDDQLEGIVDALMDDPGVPTINLSRNRLTSKSFLLLKQLFANEKLVLENLDLSYNKIDFQKQLQYPLFADEFAGSLEGNQTLKTLNLSGNKVTLASMSAFMAKIKDSTALESLVLNDCVLASFNENVEFDGPRKDQLQLFAIWAGKAPNLSKINLTGNMFNSEEMMLFFQHFKTDTKKALVDLDFSILGGVKEVEEWIKGHKKTKVCMHVISSDKGILEEAGCVSFQPHSETTFEKRTALYGSRKIETLDYDK